MDCQRSDLNRPAEAPVAVKKTGAALFRSGGRLVSFWWAASFRYDGDIISFWWAASPGISRQATIPERIAYARAPRKLPTVLGGDEVVRFLESVSSLKARVALTTAYAAGLRVSEVAALKVSDIDSSRMLMRIEHGKRGMERYARLSAPLLGIQRAIGG